MTQITICYYHSNLKDSERVWTFAWLSLRIRTVLAVQSVFISSEYAQTDFRWAGTEISGLYTAAAKTYVEGFFVASGCNLLF